MLVLPGNRQYETSGDNSSHRLVQWASSSVVDYHISMFCGSSSSHKFKHGCGLGDLLGDYKPRSWSWRFGDGFGRSPCLSGMSASLWLILAHSVLASNL